MTTATFDDLDTIDLSDLTLWEDGPPHSIFTRLREEAPIHWSSMADYPKEPGFWSLTRAADIAAASRDFKTFSSERGGIGMMDDIGIPLELMTQQMIMMDPPRHDRIKALVQRGFAPRAVARLEDGVAAIVDEVLGELDGRTSFDLVTGVSARVPSTVIASVLGVPRADAHKLVDWTNRSVGFEDPTLRSDFEDGMRAVGEMAEYVGAMIAERRSEPRDDLVSELIAAEVDGERLNDTELIMFFWLLMIGGSDTTNSALAGGVKALIEHPDQWRLLQAQPERIPDAVEEILRYVSPFSQFRRTATRDVEMHGQAIAEGDKVILWYASGNRDTSIVQDGQRFDVTREPVDHQAFGGGGRHFCLGAGLARLELRVALERTLRRFGALELDGEPVRVRSTLVNQLRHLPVRIA